MVESVASCPLIHHFTFILLVVVPKLLRSFESTHLLSFLLFLHMIEAFVPDATAPVTAESPASSASHTSNHAVIVSSSRYWFNYRHTTNALSIYRLLKDNGFSDGNIVLMVADEYSVNDRNVFKNKLITKGRTGPSLYDEHTQIDYRGDDVSVDNLLRVLLGHGQERSLPVLRSNAQSHVLVYLTGHGGDQFFKFQDIEEITSLQLANAFRRMHEMGKYQELLFIADTCQAFTLADHIADQAPNVTAIGSSLKGESSYAHHSDPDLGLSVTERYTVALVEHLTNNLSARSNMTLKQGLVDPYPYAVQRAHIGFTDASATRNMDQAHVNDFFRNVDAVQKSTTDLDPDNWSIISNPSHQHRFIAPIANQRYGRGHPKYQQHVSVQQRPGNRSNIGLEPSDPVFLAWIAVLIGATCVFASSRKRSCR